MLIQQRAAPGICRVGQEEEAVALGLWVLLLRLAAADRVPTAATAALASYTISLASAQYMQLVAVAAGGRRALLEQGAALVSGARDLWVCQQQPRGNLILALAAVQLVMEMAAWEPQERAAAASWSSPG